MKLKPIQTSILIIQIIAMCLNLYAVFIKQVSDSSTHIIAIGLITAMMILSFKSWIDCNNKNSQSKSKTPSK